MNQKSLDKGKGIKFNTFAGNKYCHKCHGDGSYMYDDMHGKICELCCTHPQGFKELDKEFYPEMIGKEVCVFGCGAERDKNKSKNFFDYPLSEKKKIIKSTVKQANKMQLETMKTKELDNNHIPEVGKKVNKFKKPDKWYKEYGVCKELAQLRGYPEPKELDWGNYYEQIKDWSIDHEVNLTDMEIGQLSSLFNNLLTQQRIELKCEDCSPEDKHIIPTDRSTTRISRPCAGQDIQTIAGTLLKSKEWKEWSKYASENMLFDVDETETVDMMSDGHFNSFIEFTKNKVRTELLEEIKEVIDFIDKTCSNNAGWERMDFVNKINEIYDKLTNLLNKKDE